MHTAAGWACFPVASQGPVKSTCMRLLSHLKEHNIWKPKVFKHHNLLSTEKEKTDWGFLWVTLFQIFFPKFLTPLSEETAGPGFLCYCFWKKPVMEVVGHHPSIQHALWQHSGDQAEERTAGRKSPFKTKSCCQGNHRRGEQGKISSVLSFRQIKLRIISKVKILAYDLPRPNSCISMKNYSTWNSASHCTVTMRHFRGLSKRVNKKILPHG